MGKANRKRIADKHKREKAEAMANIIKATKLTRKQKLKIWYYKHFKKLDVLKIVNDLYGYYLLLEPKWFRKTAYEEYALAKVLGNFTDFHNVMLTKCKLMDTNWKNYYNEKGDLINVDWK